MLKRFFTGLILLLAVAVGVINSAAPAKTVLSSNEGVLRLHVIAASDSDEDQSAKLSVRDAILPLFEHAESYDDARAFLLSHGGEIQKTAEAVLREHGFDYGVQLSLGTETFPDRVYGDLLFPAGAYDALCVRLGPAEGHNWWCVLFPPLCIVSETGEKVDLDSVETESWILNLIRSLL
ncbi:MAG: stage II sporulation protein R [Clostridia bacterium]|nr:stage II sporulation protein R [Clostridia bacterium]